MADSQPHSDIKLVCFDIGGVLVRICRSWPEGCAAAGLPWREQVQPILDREKRTRRDLVHQYQTGRLETDDYCARLSAAFDGVYSAAEIRAVHDAWLLGEYEGLTPVIDRVHDAGCTTACLSNINPSHWSRMDDYPSVTRLQHRFGSHLVGHLKPEPAFYRTLETDLGVAGSEIIFFDDLVENVAAARELGWNAVHVDHERPTDGQIMAALAAHGVLDGRVPSVLPEER